MNFPQIFVIYAVKDFSVANEAEIDVFMEFPCLFYDATHVGNLISGSSAFSKPVLYIWKFSVHVLLKPRLKDFKHDIASMCNAILQQSDHSLLLTFLGIGMEIDLFQSCGHC